MKKAILVVEDEKALGSAIKDSLEKNGYSVLRADRVIDALQLLESNPEVNAIWLDHYLLGDKTGLDFMHDIRRNKDWDNIRVFVVTNSVSDDKVENYEILGIEKYFVKSNSSLSDIIGTIKESINK